MNLLKNLVKKFLKLCFSFKGRLNRKAFFFSSLKLIGLAIVYLFAMILMLTLSKIFPIYLQIPVFLLAAICVLALIAVNVGAINLQIRRMHDLNFSGWWLLVVTLVSTPGILAVDPRIEIFPEPLKTISIAIYIVTFLGFMISLLFIKGSKGENKYGKDPLAVEA